MLSFDLFENNKKPVTVHFATGFYFVRVCCYLV